MNITITPVARKYIADKGGVATIVLEKRTTAFS